MSAAPGCVALIGPTASGKSAVAMAAAEGAGSTELVSIDSMQVYRGMDIGTAKPTPAEQARVRHHLIDLVDASTDFTVAEFARAYKAVVDDITGRRCRALLVGGTGLYHRAVVDELDLPGEWPEIRARLQSDVDGGGLVAAYMRLTELDPPAAAKIDPANTRRIVRALEVCEGSGRRFSSFGPGLDSYPHGSVAMIGIRWPRPVLAERIAERVTHMMEAGLLDEVTRLRAKGLSRTAAQALGYKELLAHLGGTCTLAEAVDQITVRTRQFAVRQLRWFQRDPRIRWIDVEHDPVAEVAPAVIDALTTQH